MRELLIICTLLVGFTTVAQREAEHLYINGSVLGYDYEPKGFFRSEQVEVQGALSGVKLTIKDDNGNTAATASTDNAGNFNIKVPLGSKYNLTYTKSGYGTSAVEIDVRANNIPDDMYSSGLILKNIELILNDNETDKSIDNGKVFARIYYSNSSREFKMSAIEFDRRDRLFKEQENSTPLNLLRSSVKKNRNNNKKAVTHDSNETTENNSNGNNNGENGENTDETTDENNGNTKPVKLNLFKKSKLNDVKNWKELTSSDINKRATELRDAWEQLEQDKLVAVTAEDLILIEAREQLLLSAERELEAAKAYIDEQEDKINAQRYFMFSLIGLILLLCGFAFYLIRSIREKNRLNFELDKRNRKITASINYAERIQKSVLLKDDQIKGLLPDSFVFYQPLDVVSGDFYWFSEIDGKVIMAAVDCTGHGVPGAFMSLIGNTLMNQIVNEKKITQPGKILKHLHEGIVESLNQTEDAEASQDGMDMSICSLNKTTGEIIFSGAVNPIYVVENGDVKEVSGDLRGIGGVFRRKRKKEVTFTEQKLNLAK
ncbi:MAG: SpoIIE family protein phosphatase, partial [Crocinitomicaceae bacterium]|nr:SpoIIE family protein phosphatase [Crocinitomicaceae bacterium]